MTNIGYHIKCDATEDTNHNNYNEAKCEEKRKTNKDNNSRKMARSRKQLQTAKRTGEIECEAVLFHLFSTIHTKKIEHTQNHAIALKMLKCQRYVCLHKNVYSQLCCHTQNYFSFFFFAVHVRLANVNMLKIYSIPQTLVFCSSKSPENMYENVCAFFLIHLIASSFLLW